MFNGWLSHYNWRCQPVNTSPGPDGIRVRTNFYLAKSNCDVWNCFAYKHISVFLTINWLAKLFRTLTFDIDWNFMHDFKTRSPVVALLLTWNVHLSVRKPRTMSKITKCYQAYFVIKIYAIKPSMFFNVFLSITGSARRLHLLFGENFRTLGHGILRNS